MITDAGRYYLEHGRYPREPVYDRHVGAFRSRSGDAKPGTPDGESGRKGAKDIGERSRTAVSAHRLEAAEDLIANLQRDGEVVVNDAGPKERDDLRRVIDFAKRHHLIPAGQRIEKSKWRTGDIRVRLVSESHLNSRPTSAKADIDVPISVQEWHPLLAASSQPGELLSVSEESLPRAMRITQALLVEAEKRGYEVGWSEDASQGIEIRIDGFAQVVAIEEELVKQDVLPAASELESTYGWQRIRPETKEVPSGKLAMSVSGVWRFGAQRRWADRKRWSLEDRLGDVLSAVEDIAQAKVERKRAEEEKAEARQQAWENAVAEARVAFRRDRRVNALLEQLDSWEQARRVRTFTQAARLTSQADPEWLAWADSYADELDPLTGPVKAPEDVEPGPEDLRPYLGRWSPYGPDGC
ncbi:hypothetical protein EIL87_10265 [Saccharopolyspora rhizosphaerae]|uniref:PE-PGRS family protein n=1 Tax=Saccharopolyspora rhizosphaerae TaxID=2492662 RepID=A0A426JWU2_9PSEU|nr:hypothetical protein [Saccharopolyspora rhizosphaerae]RRO17648.1 hypothetical protein EIL87_10265 [Saccharopolyspora rhizosphaerae]